MLTIKLYSSYTIVNMKYLAIVSPPTIYQNWRSQLKFSSNILTFYFLKLVRKSWSRMTRILGREGGNLRVSVMFFKVVVQVVLLFGSETWLLTPFMGRDLESLQHRIVWRITGGHLIKRKEGGCYCNFWQQQWRRQASRRSGSKS